MTPRMVSELSTFIEFTSIMFLLVVDEQILKLKDSIETGPSVGKGLFSMKFMAQSVEKRKKEAQEVRASL